MWCLEMRDVAATRWPSPWSRAGGRLGGARQLRRGAGLGLLALLLAGGAQGLCDEPARTGMPTFTAERVGEDEDPRGAGEQHVCHAPLFFDLLLGVGPIGGDHSPLEARSDHDRPFESLDGVDRPDRDPASLVLGAREIVAPRAPHLPQPPA